jgi:membrane fusion protein (multidrug efflux system)
VRGVTDNAPGKLVPGSFASIDLPLQETKEGIQIPAQAVIPSVGGHGVFVARNEVAYFQEVEIGIRTDTQVQILSGLSVGDLILTSNLLRIREGSPVKVQPMAGASSTPAAPAGSGPSGRDASPRVGSDP